MWNDCRLSACPCFAICWQRFACHSKSSVQNSRWPIIFSCWAKGMEPASILHQIKSVQLFKKSLLTYLFSIYFDWCVMYCMQTIVLTLPTLLSSAFIVHWTIFGFWTLNELLLLRFPFQWESYCFCSVCFFMGIIFFLLLSFSFYGQLLRNCLTDLLEIFSHDRSTIGQGQAIFQILIRIMDHDPDQFPCFRKTFISQRLPNGLAISLYQMRALEHPYKVYY